jgi:predicted RNA-binding Zn ribbon-like protein
MKFIGGELCLDFVNTVGARVSTLRRNRSRDFADTVLRDKLAGYEDLSTWSRLAGLVSHSGARRLARRAVSQPQDAVAILMRAARLREALYRIFKSEVEGWRPSAPDMEILRGELSIARAHERLSHSASGFVWLWDDPDQALDRMLWAVSKSAANLLTSANLVLLRQCGGKECGWMFLDTSRNRTRRWCDMKDCGNRAKVRRFREGHK